MTQLPSFVSPAPLRAASRHAAIPSSSSSSSSARRPARAAVSSPPPPPAPLSNPSSRPNHGPPPRRAPPPPPPEPAHVGGPGELATLLAASGRDLLVLKVYSRRCRSCMAVRRPYARTAAQERERAAFLQFCAEDNVEFAKSLGLRSFPTFIIYQRGKRVDHFAGISMRTVLQALEDYE